MGNMSRLERWMVNRKTEKRARRVLDQLGSRLEVPPGARILELGSGAGGLVALLEERYHPSRIVGADFDPAQVTSAREYLTARWGSVPPSIELRTADALAIPFPDASFDLVFAMAMLHHVEDHFREFARRPQALKEVGRVLRPGGTLVYSDMFRTEDLRRALVDLGFTQEFLWPGWRREMALCRSAPRPAPAP